MQLPQSESYPSDFLNQKSVAVDTCSSKFQCCRPGGQYSGSKIARSAFNLIVRKDEQSMEA